MASLQKCKCGVYKVRGYPCPNCIKIKKQQEEKKKKKAA